MQRPQGCSVELGIVSPSLHATMVSLEQTPPYTPRSKSLDLLRSPTLTLLPERASFESSWTLRGQRISSPTFLNSSIGVEPQRCHVDREPLDSSMAQASVETCSEPKTPGRRADAEDQLRSKFSMSPIQPSKRGKARVSEDRHGTARLVEASVVHDAARSTLGNWSHSLGVAARKLHKSTLPRRPNPPRQPVLELHTEASLVETTPEKANTALRGTTSFASIRRLVTPSRRTRKVSAATRLATARPKIIQVDDATFEPCQPASGSDEMSWIDADGDAEPSTSVPRMQTTESGFETRASYSGVRAHRTRTSHGPCERRSSPHRPCQPAQTHTDERASHDPARTDKLANAGEDAASYLAMQSTGDYELAEPADVSTNPAADRKQACETCGGTSPKGPSKLKTLQLLARRPFNAFGRKIREIDVSWWPSRSSQDGSDNVRPHPDRTPPRSTVPAARGRRSEDLLSKGSPRVCETASAAHKSRSMEQDRIELPSKVVSLRPSAATAYKRRPNIPDAFVKPLQASDCPARPSTRSTVSAPLLTPRISNQRHPWMKQLQLGTSLALQADTSAETVRAQRRPQPNTHAPSTSVNVPELSLTAVDGVAMHDSVHSASQLVEAGYSAERRPPESLLGQSLPIPPRGGRRRASTISSQSSSISSPSGKVIVSRRSYGQRLRSPSSKDKAASIRSVGTSILFTETPPSTPGLCRILSPRSAARSPSRAVYIRSPSKVVLVPRYSPVRGQSKDPRLHRKASSSLSVDSRTDEELEWVDEGAIRTSVYPELVALRGGLEATRPSTRPGFIEMTEATDTLSYLVKTFSGSSGSLSLNSSPFKRNGLADPSSPRGLYGILEADEASLSHRSAAHLTGTRVRLLSKASMVSTEANSSFEDSEELQRLLDSIMAADLGNSSDTSGSRGDVALLSPFGSPAEARDTAQSGEAVSDQKRTISAQQSPMPPPPKFLLNDRPISPPDSTNMSEATHTHERREEALASQHAFGTVSGSGVSRIASGSAFPKHHRLSDSYSSYAGESSFRTDTAHPFVALDPHHMRRQSSVSSRH